MKTTIRLSVICIVLSVLSATTLNAQTPPDYALFGITPQATKAIIRSYSPLEFVIYYEDPVSATGVISLSDMSGNINYINLDLGYVVNDMQITNDYLFMCGKYTLTSSAFLASVYIPDIASGGPATVRYQVSDNASDFYKMVAYEDAYGDTRVVALGNEYYGNSNFPSIFVNNNYENGGVPYNSSSSSFSICSSYTCTQNLLFEFVNPQNQYGLSSYNFIPVNDYTFEEIIDDIVVTDHYVALIERNPNMSALAIRHCNKNNVLGTYSDSCIFCFIYDEGFSEYVCCAMMGDTIALATRGEYAIGSSVPHDTRIRTLDLVTKTITGSQAFSLNNYASNPIDMVYVPDMHTLVLLQDLIFPVAGSVNNHTFLFLEPYHPFSVDPTTINPWDQSIPIPTLYVPYVAKGICEWVYGLPFSSMDWLMPHNHFISAGGDYWIYKDLTTQPSSPSCYLTDYIPIHRIDNLTLNSYPHGHTAWPETFTINDIPTSVVRLEINSLCIEP